MTPGQAFTKGLPAGPLTRAGLWAACDSSANPGIVTIRGAHLAEMLARGRDRDFAQSTAWPLRGRPRGVLQTSGDESIEPDRDYRVAGTDWELHPLGGLVDPDWELEPRYEFPTILREVIEEHLGGDADSFVSTGRFRRTCGKPARPDSGTASGAFARNDR